MCLCHVLRIIVGGPTLQDLLAKMDAINTLEQLDEQTASLTQQLYELEDTAPWDTVGQQHLRFQISQLERRYEGLKRRAPISSSLEDFLPSPRKRQLLRFL